MGGNGEQIYWFNDDFGQFSNVNIVTGEGSSVLTFRGDAIRSGGILNLDLGTALDKDSISFGGLIGDIFIQNYSVTYDDKVDVVVPSTWSGTDDGTDIVFTQSDQTITFEGLGGVGGSTDPLDYFM